MIHSKWRLRILVNNVVKEGPYLGEHGLSMLLESPEMEHGEFILFDTGQSAEVLLRNAESMSVDWAKVRTIILSHGHYDHAGGLPGLLPRLRSGVQIIGHPSTFVPRANTQPYFRDIGVPFCQDKLDGVEYIDLRGKIALTANTILSGEIPRVYDFEEDSQKGLLRKQQGGYVDDEVADDKAIVIRKPAKGFYLICGCCHAGLLNTLKYAAEISGEKQILGIIGGLHLGSYDDDHLNRVMKGLSEWNPPLIAPLHCTGLRPSAWLWKSFGDRVRFYTTGDTIELD